MTLGYFFFKAVGSKKNNIQIKSNLELYNDLKKHNPNISISFVPGYLKIDNNLIFALSSISKRKTLLCNEGGDHIIYQSDRYGFNNPDKEWDKEKISFFLVGDSFTHGDCVNETDTIGGMIFLNYQES